MPQYPTPISVQTKYKGAGKQPTPPSTRDDYADRLMSNAYRYLWTGHGKVLIGDDPLLPPTSGYPNAPPYAAAPTAGTVAAPPKKKNPLKWMDRYDLPGYTPDWWKGLVANKNTPLTQYVMMTTALMPFLSPEDQRAMAQNVQRQISLGPGKNYNAGFGDTTTINFTPPSPVTTETRGKFLSSQRAEAALAALQRMQTAAGFKPKKLGPGFMYLQQVADTLRDFGTQGQPMSRAEYTNFLGAIDPILNEAKSGDLAPYGAIAKAFLQPFFSAGGLMNATQQQGGAVTFGAPNPQLFG